MNVNPTGNAGCYPITDAITSYLKNKGPSSEACLTPEVVQGLQNLELRLRDRTDDTRDRFDSVEIGSGAIKMDRQGTLFYEESLNLRGFARLKVDTTRLSTTFTNEQVSDRAVALSWLMDESDPLYELKRGFNQSDNGFRKDTSKEQLAQYLGDIGKRIDECFAAGEITRQEYDDLNAGLEKYTEAAAAWVEWGNAVRAVGRAYTETVNAMKKGGVPQPVIEAFAKSYQKDRENMINEFLKRSCKIDRGLLAQLVQQVRGGKDLAGPVTRQASARESAVSYL